MSTTINRRQFLQTSGLTGTGLAFSLSIGGCANLSRADTAHAWQANAWLEITADNTVSFYLHRTEMGQGTMTGLTTLIAEELEVSPEFINVKTSSVHANYVHPDYGLQITGGSSSTSSSWIPLRTAAATAREMIRRAAAQRWNTTIDNVQIADGKAHFKDISLPYGDFIDIAKHLSIPTVSLKTPEQYSKIGKPGIRLDAPMKSKGTATFGIDAAPASCLKATLVRCPVIGGTAKSWKTNGAQDMPGVKKIVEIHNGIAVIAASWWQAKEAAKAITVDWNMPPFSALSDDTILSGFRDALANNSGKVARDDGDIEQALDDAEQVIEAEYYVPYLAHATMEPMNCSVILTDNYCEIWAPTQGPDIAAVAAEHASGLRRNQVTVHTTLMGGGFGRRLNQDFVEEAVLIAKHSGLPIQLIWSREDDIQNDFYRPSALVRFKAGIDKTGNVSCLSHKGASPNIMPYTFKEAAGAVLPAWLPDGMVKSIASLGPTIYGDVLLDATSVEGIADSCYQFDHFHARHVQHDPGLRVGYWRSVGHSFNAFFMESFVDEIAHESKQDPYSMRLSLLSEHPRMTAVLKSVAQHAQWDKTKAPSVFQGIAVHHSFNTSVAMLAEISIENNNNDRIRINKIVCAVDCGQTINPDIVKAQMESGIIFGLTQALKGKITIRNGAVQQSNFHDYELIRINEVPEMDIHIIDSRAAPTGVGEPAVPLVAPALANAIFAATGKRQRSLPLSLL
ncbi:hypothetical protein A9Q99_07850 [Gammaproteobacteria bacterium 45_16_T64]|nr:hypothetical protein A9Q99_07850 [Gammaproteobacteria bacterium 45_16_T64]